MIQTTTCERVDASIATPPMQRGERPCAPLLELFESCQELASRDDFVAMAYPVIADLLPHSHFMCGIATTDTLKVAHAVNLSFPDGYLKDICDHEGRLNSPLVRRWLKNRSPVYFHSDDRRVPDTGSDGAWRRIVSGYGIRSLAGHGMFDINGRLASYFCFGGVDRWTEEQCRLLRLIVPHLHQALILMADDSRPNDQTNLSPREFEVLDLVCRGKTNYEMSRILDISPWTIKIHVKNLMTKLDVSTRGQAVAKAMHLGIIHSPRT